jgi:hypothetical protein
LESFSGENSFSGIAVSRKNSVEAKLHFNIHPDRRGLSIWAKGWFKPPRSDRRNRIFVES